jgi:phosphatidylinositol kinase/protein kinase (PI-3  family)
VLSTLGELSLVAGPLLIPYLDKLIPVVVSKLQSSSSSSEHMLEVALHTLRQLVSSTGYVVRPYFEFPHLMGTILDIIQHSANPESLRIEAMSCIGSLGIIDPEKVKELTLIAESTAGVGRAGHSTAGVDMGGRRRVAQQVLHAPYTVHCSHCIY